MSLYKWSQTAASDATADPSINWAEGQSPSSVNDSARAMMAAIAKYRDDVGGTLVSAGTATAYTVSSNQVFDTAAHMNAGVINLIMHATNGDGATLNVDGLGAFPIVSAASVAIPAGSLIAFSVYQFMFNNAASAWQVKSFFGNPYNIPIGGMMDFIGSAVPNSSFVFPYGQAISRTTYATLFSLVSTTYGTGDGSTTFNVPDLRGRIAAGKDDMGGSAASRLSSTSITSGGPTTLGGSGGADTKTILTANLPPYTPSGTISNGSITINNQTSLRNTAGDNNNNGGGGGTFGALSSTPPSLTASQASSSFTGAAQGGTSTAFSLAQPTIIVNKILRII